MRALALLAALSLLGCKETPKKAWEKMHDAACKQDVATFFARVDKTAIGKHLMESQSEKLQAAGAFRGLAESAGEQAIQKAFTEWEDDIKKGEAGDWCGAEYIDQDVPKNTVYWSTPSRKQKGGRFIDYDGKLVMVELVD
jgi:hypothetical protein